MLTALLGAGGGFGYWMVGYGQGDLGEVASYLRDAGYPVPQRGGYLSGGEGYALIGNLVIGGGGFGLTLQGATSPGYNSGATIGSGYFSFGYAIFNAHNLLVFPSLGIGGGGITVKVREAKGGSFSDLLRDPPVNLTLENGGPFIKGGLTVAYRYAFFLIGLNLGAGYTLGSVWEVNGNTSTGYPTYRQPVFWGTLVIGGGGWSSK